MRISRLSGKEWRRSENFLMLSAKSRRCVGVTSLLAHGCRFFTVLLACMRVDSSLCCWGIGTTETEGFGPNKLNFRMEHTPLG